jgi:cell wall-associated NlpC family hydrolase
MTFFNHEALDRMKRPLAIRSLRLRATALVVASVVAGAAPVAAQQSVETKPFEAYSNSALVLRDSVVSVARSQIGTKYRLGGGSPEKGFDCSGLIQYVMGALRLSVPRTAKQQAKSGLAIKRDTSRLLPGDILTFGKGKKGSVSHVGIYVGDGRYVHASSVAGRVIESSIDRPFSPLIKVWRGARRILSLDDSASAATATKGGTN